MPVEIKDLPIILLTIILAPLVGGFLFGVDRRITARMQGRMGPPIAQPFYDAIKLFSKGRMVSNQFQMVSVCVYLASIILSLVMLMTGQDLLVLLFTLALGHVLLILGAFSVKISVQPDRRSKRGFTAIGL